MSDKTYYLFGTESDTVAKFIVRDYSTKPNAKVVLFSSAKKEYIDTANLTEFTLEEARSHWSYDETNICTIAKTTGRSP